MHESGLITDLVAKIERLAHAQHFHHVTRVSVTVGALAGISPDHLRDHFAYATRGTVAEHALLDVVLLPDTGDPRAQGVWLESVQVEEPDEEEAPTPLPAFRSAVDTAHVH